MSWLQSALDTTAAFPSAPLLSVFESSLDPTWIDEALAATGTATLRRRRLPAEQVVWLVLGMALLRDRPIHDVVESLDLALPGAAKSRCIAPSTTSQARQRLGAKPMQHLFEKCSKVWAHSSADTHRWKGLAVYALDGTTLRVADSVENREHFGLASGPRGESGYPLVRLVALVAARSHLIAAAAFGPYTDSEHTYADALWDAVPADSIALVDRNFLAARVLLRLERGINRHWMTRAKTRTKWRVLKVLGKDDLLVEMDVTSNARQKDPSLPSTFVARAVGYQLDRAKPIEWLLTSLCDSQLYPKAELVALYHQRWEIELAYDEVKTHLLDRQETIRSRSVKGVEQEVWGILIAYNLVRLEMDRIAKVAKLPPSRISFITATRFIRDEWHWSSISRSPGAIPQKLQRMRDNILEFVLPPRRSTRRFPRAVKIKMSNYAKKTRAMAAK